MRTPVTDSLNEGITSRGIESLEALKSSDTAKDAMHYFFRCVSSASDVDGIIQEIERQLERLGIAKDGFLMKLFTVEELAIGSKFYYISISTLKDLMARFLNTVFELGIADTDISFGMMMRNSKVMDSGLRDIIEKHRKELDAQRADRARNDATHRGLVTDKEITDLKKRKNGLINSKFSLLAQDPISEGTYKHKMKEIDSETASLSKQKRSEYSKHLEATVSFCSDVASLAAEVCYKRMQNVII
jgi:hypothetical protein